MLYIAGSATDVMGAKSAGLRCVWVNRGHDRLLNARLAPDHEVDDLRPVEDPVERTRNHTSSRRALRLVTRRPDRIDNARSHARDPCPDVAPLLVSE